MTPDARRAFILNQTDGTVSVINAQNNALDTPVNNDSGWAAAGVGGPGVRPE